MYVLAYHGSDRLKFRILGIEKELQDILTLTQRHTNFSSKKIEQMVQKYGVYVTSNNFFVLDTKHKEPVLPFQTPYLKKQVEELSKIYLSYERQKKISLLL